VAAAVDAAVYCGSLCPVLQNFAQVVRLWVSTAAPIVRRPWAGMATPAVNHGPIDKELILCEDTNSNSMLDIADSSFLHIPRLQRRFLLPQAQFAVSKFIAIGLAVCQAGIASPLAVHRRVVAFRWNVKATEPVQSVSQQRCVTPALVETVSASQPILRSFLRHLGKYDHNT
jgi:hypothetical protein